jgi:nitrite reductase (NADH) small subunit
MTATLSSESPVCASAAIPRGSGVTALLPNGSQVAVFRTAQEEFFALDNVDPVSGAAVLARGILGDRAGRTVVISPMHKNAFDLETGVCLEDPAIVVRTHRVAVVDGEIYLTALK